MNSSSNWASRRCSSTYSRLRRSWIHCSSGSWSQRLPSMLKPTTRSPLHTIFWLTNWPGHPLEPGPHVGSRVEGRVVAVQEGGDPARGGPFEVEELRRVVPGATAVDDLVAEHGQGGEAALVARGVPELLGPPRAVGPGDVGAVAGGPDVGRAECGERRRPRWHRPWPGPGADPSRNAVLGTTPIDGDHEVAGEHFGAVDLHRSGPTVRRRAGPLRR